MARDDELDRLQRSPATIADYEDRAKRLILPTLGRRFIGDVTLADVEKVVASTSGERNKAYVVALIRKAVNFARDKKHYLPETHRNPASGVRPRPKWPRIARALDANEIARFGAALATMEQAEKCRLGSLTCFGFHSSAACGLERFGR